MAKKIDLRAPKVRQEKARVATYGTQTPLSSAAVERGSTRWLSGSYVSIEGILDVAGTFNVSGSTVISGALTIAGQTGITGPLTIRGVTDILGQLNVTGPTTLDGILDIGGDTTITGLLDVQGDTTMSGKLDVTGPMATKGTLSVEGRTTLKNDLTVEAGGKIKVGGLMIEPAVGGQINFVGGAITSDTTFGMLMNHSSKVELSAPEVLLGGTSTKAGGAMEVVGRLTARERLVLPNTPNTANSSFVPNMHIDSNGFVWRTTWAPT